MSSSPSPPSSPELNRQPGIPLADLDERPPAATPGPAASTKGDPPAASIPIWELFRFARKTDLVLIAVGTLAAAVHGALQPVFTLITGDIVNAFGDPNAELVRTVAERVVWFAVFGFICLVAAYLQTSSFMYTSYRQATRVRELYFRALLRQEAGWFDTQKEGSVTSRINADIILMQDAISEKFGALVQNAALFVSAFSIAFVHSWRMTLVVAGLLLPLLLLSGVVSGRVLRGLVAEGQHAHASAGAVAEEVFGAMRTVAAFGGEVRELSRYARALAPAVRTGERRAHINGLGMGFIYLVTYSLYGFAFWYGSGQVNRGRLDTGEVIIVFLTVMMASTAIGQVGPSLSSLAQGLGAAAGIFGILDRRPAIDNLSDEGLKPETVLGDLAFEDLHFAYPSRPESPVLRGLNLNVKAGTTVALVGHSGSCKSTLLQLLERFYDPASGAVKLDGVDVRRLSIRWLRGTLALVQQEPVLFSGSVSENVRFGKPGATDAEVEAACRLANAHDFVTRLPQGYASQVGERGSLLSGGQKQRIAIARALISNPKILLLDEATSALDTRSERVVQNALDRASKGRTTLVIAHRLSTIRHADLIVVVDEGVVVQQGTHEELMAAGGMYADLVLCQDMAEKAASISDPPGSDVAGALDDEDPDAIAPAEEDPSLDELLDVSPRSAGRKYQSSPVFRAYMQSRGDWHYILMAVLGAVLFGAIYALYAYFTAEMTETLNFKRGADLREAALLWGLVYLGLGIYAAVASYLMNVGQLVTAERVADRMRKRTFQAVVRQELAWFERPENATGALAARLSLFADNVQGSMVSWLTAIVVTLTTVVGSLILATVSCWRLGLVAMACMPFSLMCGYLSTMATARLNDKGRRAFELSGNCAVEAITSIRTVMALNRQEVFARRFSQALQGPMRACLRSSQLVGLGFGLVDPIFYFIFALAFWYGARNVEAGLCDFSQVIRGVFAVVFGSTTAGQIAALAPGYARARGSLVALFQVIDRQRAIDPLAGAGHGQEGRPTTQGYVEFREVHFAYPRRPNQLILRGVSFTAEPGQTVALVGTSGSGKSALIRLLERFYDPTAGQVLVDGVDVRDIPVADLRRGMGLVHQEPVLFAGTIRENILYGRPEATEEEVQEAAEAASAHAFIQALESGYDTDVGIRGGQLSGGQKQRVAIARAIVRKPSILLLDEATSALDSESEAIVQEALDRASKGRTTIVVAHRLATIRHADKIVVIDRGVVAQQGTHDELMAAGGVYSQLVNQQLAR
ncbi:hypothetical protein H696_01004 [Fonticula alba]|uniref:ATP-binding cassette, subfamily B (MDR/TAP), member 1 n=1 Tax=Fonticula alba TaxID=691883 RepID=A0A058ZGH1_FONAL|nr:hypothetical protein H696_01004 [Fonticula alba]KCV73465.1 hypothetical protein H696_01004 [Fonticula alba]|eukprot:XP_009493166.1 hypothetical protein H696_01004 [Fonticula alba]